MARVERYTSTEPVTVKQAGMIDPSDFRFSNISAQMLQMGGEVLYELGRRELEAKNSLAINAAVESRSLAKLKMREFMANNPDPDTWAKGTEKILAEQGKIYSQQRFNAKTRAEQEIEQQAFKDKLNTEVGIAAVTQNIENDIAISGKNLIDVISTDDGSPEIAADILDQQKTYQEALERKYPKDVAAIHMEETLREARKAFYIDQSKLNPDAIIRQMEKKKKALRKAGKDKEGLGAKDYDDIIASAYNAKALAKKSLDAQQQIELDELGQGLEDGTISWTIIQNKRSLTAEQRETYRLKMNAEALRKSQGLPIIVNQLEVSRLGDLIPDIWRDRRTYDEVKKEFDDTRFPTDGKPLIDDAIYTSGINKARTEMVKVQANSHSRIMRDVRSELRVKDESMMMLFLATLEDKEERSLAEATNQRQAERANAFEEQMYEWLKTKPEATRDDYEEFKADNLPHFRVWEPGMPLPIEREELPVIVEPQILPGITLMDIAPILENAKVDRLTIYTEARKLSPIWDEMTKEEQLTAYQALAQGMKGQQIVDYFNRK